MANRLVDSDLHRQVAEAKPVSGLASIWALGMSAKTLAYKFFEQGAERVDDDSVEARLANMFNAVNQKFTVNSDLGDLLVETGDQLIVEGNDHGDTFWGVDSRSGEGQNHLGQTLMRVRGGLALAT